jgi:hypothetical protein
MTWGGQKVTAEMSTNQKYFLFRREGKLEIHNKGMGNLRL